MAKKKTLVKNSKKEGNDKSKGKIVLFNPQPTTDFYDRSIPIALLSIAGYLDEEGYEIKVIDATPSDTAYDKVLKECEGAICLGISVLTGHQTKGALEISKMVKEKWGTKVVWGGWHVILLPEQTLENEYVDVVALGQGQRVFYETVKAFQGKGKLKDVKGIAYRDSYGDIFNNGKRDLEDINVFPKFPWHLVDMNHYVHRTSFGKRTVTYNSSEGCPHRCGFCSVHVAYKRRYTYLLAERVLDDIEYLYKTFKIDSVVFNDNNFFVSQERTKAICQGFLERGIKIRWGRAMGRAKQMHSFSDETWDLMRESGLYNVLIGAESASQCTLDLIQKDATVEDTVNFTKKCKKYGIKIEYSFMIGIPDPALKGKSYKYRYKYYMKEYKSTRAFIDQVRLIDRGNKFLLCSYTPYPGTTLYDTAVRLGFKPPTSLEGWKEFDVYQHNIPYLPTYFSYICNMITNYVFLTWGNWNYAQKEKNILKKLGYYVFYFLATLRWKLDFWYLPVDYKLQKWLLKKVLAD